MHQGNSDFRRICLLVFIPDFTVAQIASLPVYLFIGKLSVSIVYTSLLLCDQRLECHLKCL